MKMHTYFLSGKAIAIVSGAFGACGMLLFVSGVLVGVRVQVDGAARGPAVTSRTAAAVEATPAAQPAGPVAAPAGPAAAAQSTPAASPGAAGAVPPAPAAPAASASIGATADASDASAASAAWPFTSSAFAPSTLAAPQSAPMETMPAPLPAAAPSQAAPAAPLRTPRAPRATMGDVSMIAYVPPSSQAAPRVAPVTRGNADDDAEYLVQVGIFRVEQHAKELVDRLSNAGYRATITERQEGDRALHVVRVGRFTGLATAEKVAARIGGSEQLVASVVAAPR